MPTLYDMSIPVFVRALENLAKVLKVGEKWAEDSGIPQSRLVEARLAPDMNALPFQVQAASNAAKFVPVRVIEKEALVLENEDTSFAEFYDRIQKTIEYLKTTTPGDFEGKDEKEIVLSNGKYKPHAVEYLQNLALPNFFFHITTAYAILRKEGVPVGKSTYLGI